MKVFGILSDERAHRSKSPAMHNAVLTGCGVNGVYAAFEVFPDKLAEAIKGLRALNIAGVNVTVPYKEKIIPFLDHVAEEAQRIGAVNTVVNDHGRLIGRNTDGHGFLDALNAKGFDPSGKPALVLGAGGAARAIVWALEYAGASRITVAGRDLARTAAMAGKLGATPMTLASLPCAAFKAALVVNTTTVSDPDEGQDLAAVISRLSLDGCEMVYDINYGREKNLWRTLAMNHLCAFEDGLSMLGYQARRSFALWTGLEIDVREFLNALRTDH